MRIRYCWIVWPGDLGSGAATGRCRLTAESALRCALLKQYRQSNYEELAFHLLDSASFGAFARLPLDWTLSKAALQANTRGDYRTHLGRYHTQLLGAARQAGVEHATMWHLDSTVIDSPIHAPSDASLLLDSVRVMVRLLAAGQALPGAPALRGTTPCGGPKKARAGDSLYPRPRQETGAVSGSGDGHASHAGLS